VSFCSPDEERLLAEIERMLKRPIPVLQHAGRTPAPRAEVQAESRGSEAKAPAATAKSRSPRATEGGRTARPPQDRHEIPRHDDKSHYDLNPDQPLPAARTHGRGSFDDGRPVPAGNGRRPKEVPALLRRPSVKETQKA
jgi:hypothetical protein